MSSYARYCQTQATHCARRAKLASSPDVKAYHRRLALQWLKLAEKARVASGQTRPLHARMDLRDARVADLLAPLRSSVRKICLKGNLARPERRLRQQHEFCNRPFARAITLPSPRSLSCFLWW